jgi:membrane-bound lytic murein transglycosylase MltF
LNRQKEQLQELQNQAFYSSIAEQTLEKVIKGCETAMQNAVLLQQENHRLNMENQRQKKKKQVPRYFIQEEGSLTVEEALRKVKEREEAESLTASSSRARRPPRCSNCNMEGHNRTKCPNK